MYKAAGSREERECTHYALCYIQLLLFKVAYTGARVPAMRRQREQCMARQMQACLLLRQF